MLRSLSRYVFFVSVCLFSQLLQAPKPAASSEDHAAFWAGAIESQQKETLTQHLASKYRVAPSYVRSIVNAAYSEASKEQISPLLVLAVIEQESSLNPAALSSYGAVGLMQVVPRFHAEKLEKGESLKNPLVNIRVGTKVLAEYLKTTSSEHHALKKYSGNANDYALKIAKFRNKLQEIRNRTALSSV